MNKINFFNADFFKKFNIHYTNEYLNDDDKEKLINEIYKGALYNKNIFYDKENNKTIITYNIASNRQNYIEFKTLLNTLFLQNNFIPKFRDSPISCFPHIPNPLATGSISIKL